MERECMRVSDLIDENEIESWKPGDTVTIRAQTGAGKSYFIKNDLFRYAAKRNKKILMLLHRDNTVSQFRGEVERDGKADTIHVRTYQFLEVGALHGRERRLEQYDYIVVDECHYFISDSTFNNRTDLSFEAILCQTGAVRIFMSATIEDIRSYLNLGRQVDTKDYSLPEDYGYITGLHFFGKGDVMEELAKRFVEQGEKAIFFIHKARDAWELYRKFKDVAIFNCSKGNSLFSRVNEEKIGEMLRMERFDSLLLITTSCFDSGANIVDEAVRHIVIDMKDYDTVIQCAGRKRIRSDDDRFDLYIKDISNQQLGGFETSTNRKLEMARFLLKHNTEELIKHYPRQNDAAGLIYDVLVDGRPEKKVNPLMLEKKIKDLVLFRRMKDLGDHGFSKYIARQFGFYDAATGQYKYQVTAGDYGLSSYLERHLGEVMLGKADRKELIDKLNIRQDGHQLKGLESVNAALRERGLPYQVKAFATCRMVDGKKKNYKSAWRIERVFQS